MKILLGFLPFLAFAVANALGFPTQGLVAGAAVAAGVLVWNKLSGRTLKLLDLGSVILFGALAVHTLWSGRPLPVGLVRLCVDGGLLLIVLITMAIGRPFTMDYARESVAPELWDSPGFRRTNQVISLAWAAAFAVIVVADLALWKGLLAPARVTLIIVIAVVVAIKFTGGYVARVRKDASAP